MRVFVDFLVRMKSLRWLVLFDQAKSTENKEGLIGIMVWMKFGKDEKANIF